VLECVDGSCVSEVSVSSCAKKGINELKEKITHQIEEKITRQAARVLPPRAVEGDQAGTRLEKDDKTEEIDKYQAKLNEFHLGDEAKNRIAEEIEKLKVLSQQSPEYAVSRTYLDWLTGLPWSKYSEDRLDVAQARVVLDRDHYGLEDVKARILEFIGVAEAARVGRGLDPLPDRGRPGWQDVAGPGDCRGLGRQFFRFSLGGIRDEAEIKGHRRTYIGALPGKVMQAMKVVGTPIR